MALISHSIAAGSAIVAAFAVVIGPSLVLQEAEIVLECEAIVEPVSVETILRNCRTLGQEVTITIIPPEDSQNGNR